MPVIWIYKGVPQGSILGPVLFNIFTNDIVSFVNKCDLYNYADDNTLSYSDSNVENLVQNLESDSQSLIQWFSDNLMQANPDKFQAIALGKKSKDQHFTFNVNGSNIPCDDDVKLLGVTIDRQLNVLKRIGKHLCKLGKLNIYYSFILSNFNYCPLTWHFCGETHTKKIEKIQERA